METRRVLASLAGGVFQDSDSDGVADPDESGLAGVVVYLDANRNGVFDQTGVGFDPDDFVEGQVLNHASNALRTSGTTVNNVPAFRVTASADPRASTGQRVFGVEGGTIWDATRRLRFDLSEPTDAVSLDVVGAATATTNVRLDALDASGRLLQSASIGNLRSAAADRLVVRRAAADIVTLVAYVTSDRGSVRFDNLRVGDATSEMATRTNARGFYRFDGVPSGSEYVSHVAPAGYQQTKPFPSLGYEVVVSSSVTNLNFGNHTAALSGSTFSDEGIEGAWEPSGPDVPLPGTTLYLDLNENGIPDTQSLSVDPSEFAADEVLERVSSRMRITVADEANQPTGEYVTAARDDAGGAGDKLFARDGVVAWTSTRRLRVDFAAPASLFEIDFIAGPESTAERGVLLAFTFDGRPIASQTTAPLSGGQRQTLAIQRPAPDIGYVVVYTGDPSDGAGRLDNLRAAVIDEPVTVSDAAGDYQFTPLAAGDYLVGVVAAANHVVTFPATGQYDAPAVFGETVTELAFGLVNTNQAPRTVGDFREIAEDSPPVAVNVLANDRDADGLLNPFTVRIVQEPAHGTARVDLDGRIVYTPRGDFAGTDALFYTVMDDLAIESLSTRVRIDVLAVNDAPRGGEDAVTARAGVAAIIDVLSNDADVDGTLDNSSLTIVQPPTGGVAEVDPANGTLVYTADMGFAGVDELRYTVADDQGLASQPVTVRITVVGEGTPPVAADDAAATREGTKIELAVLANDSDRDGLLDPASIFVTTAPAHGKAIVDAASGRVVFQPTLGYVGDDSFRYVVRDDAGLASNEAEVTISITERAFPYQNPVNALDIDGDGVVSPRDALFIINELNARRFSDPITSRILVNPTPPNRPLGYYDVNGDGFIVPRDALRVINFVNDPPPLAAATSSALDPIAVAAAFADDPWNDDDHQEKSRLV